MTSAALPVEQTSPFAFLHRHWRLFAVVLLGIGPFVPSIIAMRDFVLADNALGFTPFALPAAAWLFWARSRGERAPGNRDLLIDLFLASPLLLTAFFVLFVTPGGLSWYFWLNRVDLAALAPWVTAVGLVFLGYQQVLRTWPAWLMLVLAWPWPAVWLQRLLTPAFTDATAWVGRVAVDFLRLPYAPAEGTRVFWTTHLPEGDNFVLIIGQLCSGTAATIGFLIVGLMLGFLSRGTALSRLRWVVVGLLLAFASNLVRVVVLLTVATTASRETAVEVVHPILGSVLFLLVTALMLVLLRPFGLRFDPVPHGRFLVWEPAKGGGRPLRVAWALMAGAALAVGFGVQQAQALNFIGVGDGAPALAVESERGILPEVEGWTLEHETRISWTDLFGGTSRGDVFSYYGQAEGPEAPRVGVQSVVTEDRSTLHRYTIEQCIDFYRRDVEARRAVDLGYGVTGIVLHHVHYGIPSSVVYWEIPVTVDGRLYHTRTALFGNVETPTYLAHGEAARPRNTPATTRLGQRLDTAMSGLPSGTDDVRAETDRGLVALAIAIVDTMVSTGGPARTLEEP